MKILSVVWFQVLPARFGGQKATALFQKHLAQIVPLVCLASRNNAADEPIPYRLRAELPEGRRHVLDPRTWRQIADVALEEKPSHLLVEFPYLAIAAERVHRKQGIPWILRMHNIEYARFRSLGKWWWPLLRRYEAWACRKASLVLFLTEADRDHAVKAFRISTSKTMVAPYGVEAKPAPAAAGGALRQQLDIGPQTKVFLFGGTLDYAPNADAVRAIYEELAPRLDALGVDYKVLLCGRNREAAFSWINACTHPRVQQLGEVAGLAPLYAAADVFINPVLSGGGMQTKVLDALAHHCTVTAFQFTLEGIKWELAGKKVQPVANGNWDAFAASLSAATQQRTTTPDEFLRYYNWQEIVSAVAQRLSAQ